MPISAHLEPLIDWQARAEAAEAKVIKLEKHLYLMRRMMHHEARNLSRAAEKIFRRPAYISPKEPNLTHYEWMMHAYKFRNWLLSSSANLRHMETLDD